VSERTQFQRAEAIFRAALREAEGERAAFVQRSAGDDEELLEQVLALLAEDEASSGALDEPALGARLDLDEVERTSTARPAPERIGGHIVVRLLGQGGMGVVYEAEQQSPRRTVALKVLHPGVASPGAASRLRREAHLLGRLQHPGIAQIFEAGVFDYGDGGRPYFAMELIRGKPIDRYAEDHRLAARQRLELFLFVCDAVQHAHERGVIHRDLKPANILVDESGRPKVLDFGVARATGSDIHAATLQTHAGQLVGTVPYMSPEQAEGDPSNIDERSDVYSLGVVLYELLAGRLPHDVSGRLLHEAVRVIREIEPASLSSVNSALGGDIETIVRTALEKDRRRRYQSALALGEDLRRHLADEPITARRPSALYELRKFSRRNRALVIGASAVVATSLLGAGAASWQALAATRARIEAERRRDTLAAVNAFLNDDLLAPADPKRVMGGGDITLIEAVGMAAASLDERFADAPEAEGLIRETIGRAYLNQDRVSEATPHLRRAVALARSAGETGGTLAHRLTLLGMALYDADDLEGATAPLEEAVAIVEGSAEIDPSIRVSAYSARSSAKYWGGDLEGALADVEAGADIARRRLPGSQDLCAVLSSLAVIKSRVEGPAASVPIARESVEAYRVAAGPEHPDTLVAINNLAMLLTGAGAYEEAESLFLTTLEARQRTLGPEHSDVFITQGQLARLYALTDRFEAGEALGTASYASFVRLYGAEHRYSRATARTLAELYERWGDAAAAARWRDLGEDDAEE